jgi:hypothetical protein
MSTSAFPRGWAFSVRTAGVLASITVAATAGVVHVLDSVDAKMFNGSGAQVGLLVQLNSSDGVFAGFQLAELEAVTPNGTDEISLSNLDLAAGPGASLTVTYNGGIALVNENLLIQGHDI